ncbi:hypothetical protein [Streptomyces sp. NPDC086787]|uniref:hypothetical protein n=1 Tax=Streptomyces sp. NPDC086787 TaxID=3365759 RepID=UPI003803801E
MLRGLAHVLAWSLATGAAVTLSWWGVHTVMAGTAYDPPRALPITADDAPARSPKPSDPAVSGPPAASRGPSGEPSASRTASRAPAPAASGQNRSRNQSESQDQGRSQGQVRSYDTDGGRAVFELGRTSATLVSATPGTGWSMQVWKTESWIRVDFARSTDRVTVFCTWHDGPPHVTVNTY